VGGGHLIAARALAAELEALGTFTTRLVDAYVDCGRFPLPLFPRAYAILARHHPHLWSMIYHSSGTRFAPRNILRPFLRDGFARLLAEEQPDLVVSVLPGVIDLLADATARTGARLEVVLTDWQSVHRFWVAAGVQHYTAPTDSARADCIRFGARPECIDVVGIPVRRAFGRVVDRQLVRQQRLGELGLDPHVFTILSMVGAEGSPRALANLAQVASLDLDAQLVVICGRNEDLRADVAAMPSRLPLRAVGFIEDIAELMRSADLLLTKAGGLTLAEAFCSHVPVVVQDLLPGQETGNLRYVLDQDAVEYAPDPGALGQLVKRLREQPERRTALIERGSRLARPDAARTIAANLQRRLELHAADADLGRHGEAK
jgi:UDP-N-acetylglucosamine:LPS N-acetylglucosamine transferase